MGKSRTIWVAFMLFWVIALTVLIVLRDRRNTLGKALSLDGKTRDWQYGTSHSQLDFQYLTEKLLFGTHFTTNHLDPQHKSPKVWNISQSPTLDEDLDNLRLRPLPYLENVKNPCWIEAMPSTEDSTYYHGNIIATIFGELKQVLKQSAEIYENPRAESGQTWRLRCLPYYFIIGVSKCGTTDLNNIISKHPRVVAPPRKELAFWNRIRYTVPQPEQNPHLLNNLDYLTSRVTWPLKEYIDIYDLNAIDIGKQYSSTNDKTDMPYFDKITGDATPNYIWDFDGWRKLAANKGFKEPKYILANLIKMVTPMAKIIAIVRDPVERAWSEYMFFQSTKPKSPELFHDLILRAITAWNDCLMDNTVKFCAYDQKANSQTMPVRLRVGLYYVFIKDWLRTFGASQFLLLRFEDWAIERTPVANKIFQYLDLVKCRINFNVDGVQGPCVHLLSRAVGRDTNLFGHCGLN